MRKLSKMRKQQLRQDFEGLSFEKATRSDPPSTAKLTLPKKPAFPNFDKQAPCDACKQTGLVFAVFQREGVKTRCMRCNGVGWIQTKEDQRSLGEPPTSKELGSVQTKVMQIVGALQGLSDDQKKLDKQLRTLGTQIAALDSRLTNAERGMLPAGTVAVTEMEMRAATQEIALLREQRDKANKALKAARRKVTVNIDTEAVEEMSWRLAKGIEEKVNKRLQVDGLIKQDPPQALAGKRAIKLEDKDGKKGDGAG